MSIGVINTLESVFPKSIEIRINRTPQWLHDGLEVRILDFSNKSYCQMITMVPKMEGQYIEPCMNLSMEQGQRLIDQLWECGLRPTEGTGSAGQKAAMESHINDLQKIVFALIGEKAK